jgi:uncharacterized protein (TIRG00374 family)
MSINLAVFSVLLDRFLDLVILIMMLLPSLLLVTGAISSAQAFLILISLMIGQGFIIIWKEGETFHFFLSIYRLLVERVFSKVPFLGSRIKEGTRELEGSYHFDLTSVFRIITWNFIKYFFLSLRFYFTGQAFGVLFPWVRGFFFLPLIQISGLINITPAGLGVTEMGTYGALFLMGIPKSQILIFVLGQRILLLSIILILFALNHLFYLIQSMWDRVEGLEWK